MITKKQKNINLIPKQDKYNIDDAIQLVKKFATCKFDETIEIIMNLGIDPQQSDQVVKGFVCLPHGSGKQVKVAVVTTEDRIKDAKLSNADVVGSLDLIEDMSKGNLDYDAIVATPDIMLELSKIGRILGPKKLMPNPKLGTVTFDIIDTVKNIKSGQVNVRTEKNGILHGIVGKSSFSDQKLKDNIIFMISEISKMKPANAKGLFICKVNLCSTMGPSIMLNTMGLL